MSIEAIKELARLYDTEYDNLGNHDTYRLANAVLIMAEALEEIVSINADSDWYVHEARLAQKTLDRVGAEW